VESILIFVGSEPLPAKADHRGVIDPEKIKDDEGEDVGHDYVGPAGLWLLVSCVGLYRRSRRQTTARCRELSERVGRFSSEGYSNSKGSYSHREHEEVIAVLGINVAQVVDDVDGEHDRAGERRNGKEPD
jgi:hypothetical protein